MQAIGVRVNTALRTEAAEAVTATLCWGRAAGYRQGSGCQPSHTAYLARPFASLRQVRSELIYR
jgi:hypothetical protein